MTTLTINIDVEDSVIENAGEDYLKGYIQEQVKAYRAQVLGKEIRQAIDESGVDIDKEFKEAKKEAWKEYKNEHLKDILK